MGIGCSGKLNIFRFKRHLKEIVNTIFVLISTLKMRWCLKIFLFIALANILLSRVEPLVQSIMVESIMANIVNV